MAETHCNLQMMGGLGNQLFQIAAAYAHCKRHGHTLTISSNTRGGRNTYWNTLFKHLKDYTVPRQKRTIFRDNLLRNVKPLQTPGILWKEPRFAYTPIPATASALSGYFQSSQYFQDCANEIRQLFTFDTTRMQQRHGALLTRKDATVLHIRRGDYVSAPTYHGILSAEWYKEACVGRTNLLVFSDDLPWCRGLDFLKGATFVDEPDEAVALQLMSQFHRFILSNSSFSWWAAWLSGPDADVVIPDRWFGPAGPQDYQDIYEPTWKRLPVK